MADATKYGKMDPVAFEALTNKLTEYGLNPSGDPSVDWTNLSAEYLREAGGVPDEGWYQRRHDVNAPVMPPMPGRGGAVMPPIPDIGPGSPGQVIGGGGGAVMPDRPDWDREKTIGEAVMPPRPPRPEPQVIGGGGGGGAVMPPRPDIHREVTLSPLQEAGRDLSSPRFVEVPSAVSEAQSSPLGQVVRATMGLSPIPGGGRPVGPVPRVSSVELQRALRPPNRGETYESFQDKAYSDPVAFEDRYGVLGDAYSSYASRGGPIGLTSFVGFVWNARTQPGFIQQYW